MIVTTTPSVEGSQITDYHGIVVGEDLPQDVLETARKAEQQRRENSELLVLGEDDTSWLLEE